MTARWSASKVDTGTSEAAILPVVAAPSLVSTPPISPPSSAELALTENNAAMIAIASDIELVGGQIEEAGKNLTGLLKLVETGEARMEDIFQKIDNDPDDARLGLLLMQQSELSKKLDAQRLQLVRLGAVESSLITDKAALRAQQATLRQKDIMLLEQIKSDAADLALDSTNVAEHESALSLKPQASAVSDTDLKLNENAFQERFLGDTSCTYFLAHLKSMHAVQTRKEYFPFLSVIQSSGWGKTRLMFEFSKRFSVPLLYFCLREEGKRGFPLRHSSVNQFQHGLLADDGESFGMRFIRSAINLARSEPLSSNLSNGWVESSAPNSTASLYESFWSCVLKNMTSTHPTAVEHPPLSELPCATSTSAKSSVSGKDTSSAAESVKPDTPADAASPYRIILVFDEAHVLVNNLRLAAPKISLFRVLRRSLWAIKDELERENVLVVFMDTTSQVSTFTPPDEQDDSARPTAAGPNLDDLPRLIYPPFSAIGSRPSDFTRRAEIVSNSLQITSVVSETGGAAASASVSSPVVPDDELLAMLRGRPLWRAYFNAFLARRNLLGGTRELFLSESLHALVCFAQSKLLGGRSQFISTDSTLMYSASASVGCCLLNLVPNPGKRLSATLVHSHMATLLSISEDRKELVSVYFSEPILTHAALDLFLRHPIRILEYLHSAFQRADLGSRGEFTSLVACLLLMVAPLNNPRWIGGVSAVMPVQEFLQRMFADAPVIVLTPPPQATRSAALNDQFRSNYAKSLQSALCAPDVSSATAKFVSSDPHSSSAASSAFADNSSVPNSNQFSEAAVLLALRCRRATINLTHFVPFGRPPHVLDLEKYYRLSAGMLMKRGFVATDWILPIRLENDNGTVVFSMIAVQVKNYGDGVSDAAARIFHDAILWRGVFCAEATDVAAPPPFVTLIISTREASEKTSNVTFELGTQTALGRAAMTCTLRGFPSYLSAPVRKILASMVSDEDLVTTLINHRGSESDRSWAADVISSHKDSSVL